jgi:hypothetical protein
MVAYCLVLNGNWTEGASIACLSFQPAKQLHVAAHFTRGMQNLKSQPKLFGGCIFSLGGEVGHLAQAYCRKKQQNEPCTPTDVSGGATPKKPRYARYPQNNKRSEPPSVMWRAGTPCPSQRQERRDYGDEEKNVVEIHNVDLRRR